MRQNKPIGPNHSAQPEEVKNMAALREAKNAAQPEAPIPQNGETGTAYSDIAVSDDGATQLQTARLLLRRWRDEDAAELYRYACDPLVGPIAGWPVHTSVENSREIIRGILSAPLTYAVVLKETGLPVGSVGIMRRLTGGAPMDADEAEIGYWIGVPYWGQGLIPEAVRALLTYCFTVLGTKGVWCGYYDGNVKSKRVQEKCGFVFHHTTPPLPSPMGDLRVEHFTYLSRSQWLAQHNSAPDGTTSG